VKTARQLRWSLRSLGLSDTAIEAAWPEWWSEAAEASTSAQSELRFSIARKLGLDPRSLLEDQPRFIWRDEAKFKRLTTESELERAALASFGISVGRALLSATAPGVEQISADPRVLREMILRYRPYITLDDLMVLSWGLGVPVIYLRVFPLQTKKMNGMLVQVGNRFAILLARDANYPAPIAFYLAHELGHAALGHTKDHAAVVEFGDLLTERGKGRDDEENAADRFALELLTGMPEPQFLPEGSGFNAPAIADAALRNAEELKIEPGMIALCFGHSTGAWPRVFASLKMIYSNPLPVWMAVNRVAFGQLDWTALSDDTRRFLAIIMGGSQPDEDRSRQ
jgi:Zn-dependent peptidase ImmA (M78 family)